jgi:predicted nucleic-acid-binding Zn-ribbon protein
MRTTKTCPKCAKTKIAVIADFRQPDSDSTNGIDSFPVITIRTPGFIGGRESIGRFSAWVCIACGYTEFYAEGLEDLAALASHYPDQVRIVGG